MHSRKPVRAEQEVCTDGAGSLNEESSNEILDAVITATQVEQLPKLLTLTTSRTPKSSPQSSHVSSQ